MEVQFETFVVVTEVRFFEDDGSVEVLGSDERSSKALKILGEGNFWVREKRKFKISVEVDTCDRKRSKFEGS